MAKHWVDAPHLNFSILPSCTTSLSYLLSCLADPSNIHLAPACGPRDISIMSGLQAGGGVLTPGEDNCKGCEKPLDMTQLELLDVTDNNAWTWKRLQIALWSGGRGGGWISQMFKGELFKKWLDFTDNWRGIWGTFWEYSHRKPVPSRLLYQKQHIKPGNT